MAIGTSFRAACIASCATLTACVSTPQITVKQSVAIASPPRTANLTLDANETLPFGISRERVAAAMAQAGFAARSGNAGYRLLLSAGAGSSRTGSYVPGSTDKAPNTWVGRPDRSLQGRVFPGHMLRVTAVLVDSATDREVWRGTGTLRTANPNAAAPQLVDQILARLPRQ